MFGEQGFSKDYDHAFALFVWYQSHIIRRTRMLSHPLSQAMHSTTVVPVCPTPLEQCFPFSDMSLGSIDGMLSIPPTDPFVPIPSSWLRNAPDSNTNGLAVEPFSNPLLDPFDNGKTHLVSNSRVQTASLLRSSSRTENLANHGDEVWRKSIGRFNSRSSSVRLLSMKLLIPCK